jgi:hypothetical protein
MIRKRHDLIGKRFGFGVVVEELGEQTVGLNSKYPRQFQTWKLKCDCGNEYISSTKYLQINQSLHCGCLRRANLLGKIFGLAKVIRYVGSQVRGKTSPRPSNVWELKCECGNIFQTHAEYLTSGCTSSCGCRRVNFKSSGGKKSPTLYMTQLRKGARKRNLDFTISSEFCFELLNAQNHKCKLSGLPISFENGSASIDRIDNSKAYTSENIQWVHRQINYMKNTLSNDEFLRLCSVISDFSRLQKS